MLPERISRKNLAMLVVDMQEHYLQHISPRKRRIELVRNILLVIRYATRNNIPIFALQAKGRGRTIPILFEEINRNQDHNYLTKIHPNGFLYTDLGVELEKRNRKDLLLTGVYALACLKSTAIGAIDNRYGILTSRELMKSTRPENEDKVIPWFKENGIYRENHQDLLQLID